MESIMVLGEGPRVGKLFLPIHLVVKVDFSRSLPPYHLLWKKAASAFGEYQT